MDRIHLVAASMDGGRFERTVSSVTLPSAYGSLGILAGHAPMLCAVEEGTVVCRSGEEAVRIRVSGGIAHVANNELRLLLSHMEIEEP